MTPEESEELEGSSTPDLLTDCRLMLRFARREGRNLSSELCEDIARLDSILKDLNLPAVSTVPKKLIAEAPDWKEERVIRTRSTREIGMAELPSKIEETRLLSPTELVLKVHGALSQIIAPATAQSLQVSEPPPGRHRFLGGMPILVKAAAWTAIACALGFVMTSIPAAKEKLENLKAEVAPRKSTPTPSPEPAK